MKKIVSIMVSIILCMMPVTINAMELKESSLEVIYSLEPIEYNNPNITYHYEMQNYGAEKLVGFYFGDEYYQYIYDETEIITGIRDLNGNQIVSYTYDENHIVSNVYSVENYQLIENDDENFIGNINKMYWLGMFFDETTHCYYIDGRYFNPITNRYMDGNNNDSIFTDTNPFLNNEEGIMLIGGIDEYATEWAESLLNNSSYGTPISYSNGWYSSLSDVELLARAIYCEGGTAYTSEGAAVAWVILNRVNSTNFPSSARSVITAADQFTSVTGKSGPTTSARQPSTSTERWEYATYLACLMYTTYSAEEWNTVVSNPIGDHLYFYSYTTAQNAYKNNTPVFSGENGNLKYNSKNITNVYVLGYGIVTSFPTLFSNYTPISYSRNIYYNYK
jgi:hypothetical protein